MPKALDLTGQRYGKLTVKEFAGHLPDGKRKARAWLCECDCGNQAIKRAHDLRSGHVKSCGCIKSDDLTGQRFGRLTAVKVVGRHKSRQNLWLCKCACGNEHVVAAYVLKRGASKSCGCIRKAQSLNSLREHPLYSTWCNMRSRCNSPKNAAYKYYGAKGVRICKEWEDSKAFIDWAFANGWAPGLTIDRIDPYGDYSPDNCRWVTYEVQSANRRVREGKKAIGILKLPSGRYFAQLKFRNKLVYQHTSDTFEEAVKLRDAFIDKWKLPHTKCYDKI